MWSAGICIRWGLQDDKCTKQGTGKPGRPFCIKGAVKCSVFGTSDSLSFPVHRFLHRPHNHYTDHAGHVGQCSALAASGDLTRPVGIRVLVVRDESHAKRGFLGTSSGVVIARFCNSAMQGSNEQVYARCRAVAAHGVMYADTNQSQGNPRFLTHF